MPLALSIIVPVFNVDAYLEKCVKSLLDQDLVSGSYEIILVDDGSTDTSGSLCDRLASLHKCIRVIHQPNKGLGAARNTGIDIAQGTYLLFVDSDDYLDPNVLGRLVNKMESDRLDVLRFNYRNVNEDGKAIEPNKISRPFMNYSDNVCDGLTFLNERLGFGCYACQFILRRSLLNDCRFKEGIFFEDTEWTPRMLSRAQKVSSTDTVVYNYLMRVGSITQGKDLSKRRRVLEDKFQLIDFMNQQMASAYDKRWFRGMITQTSISIIGCIAKDFYSERHLLLRRLSALQVFPLSTFHATRAATRKILIANISPLLLCYLLHL